MNQEKDRQLTIFLNRLQKEYHQEKFLNSDPLEFAHRYSNPWDQEAVALVSSLLAYGNVKQIRKSVENALSRMQTLVDQPQNFVRGLSQASFRKKALQVFDSYVHRFNSGVDIVLLFYRLNRSWAKFGTLGDHFLSYLKPTHTDIGSALSSLTQEWKTSQDLAISSPTFSYLLSSPSDGSCCKRWCMFLRWMGRKDSVDLGLWTVHSGFGKNLKSKVLLKSSQLVMPLDTHTGRISQYLGLTSRKNLNWKAALEITESLKRVDPSDPTRYDFALSRLGILDICQRSYREEICIKCQLLPVCQFAQKYSRGPLPSMPHSA